jgi:hypothetical protein
MKKTIITIAIILGMGIGVFAQDGGLFGYGNTRETTNNRDSESTSSLLSLPNSHGETSDQGAPLGSGILLLLSFGAAYAIKKKQNE